MAQSNDNGSKPSITELLVKWVDEYRNELGTQNNRITRLETIVKGGYALVIIIIAAAGVIVALLAHLKSVAS